MRRITTVLEKVKVLEMTTKGPGMVWVLTPNAKNAAGVADLALAVGRAMAEAVDSFGGGNFCDVQDDA